MFIILLVLLTVSIIGIRVYYLSKVTTGDRIPSNLSSKSALIVLDVQEDTLGIKEYSNTDSLMKNINSAITYANDNNIDILYTRQAFSNSIDKLLSAGLYAKNSKGSELSQQLKILSSQIYDKERNDAFSNGDLESYLLQKDITTIYLVGADASACVYKTALAGVRRDYKVIVLEDCIFSVNDKLLNKAINNYRDNDIEIKNLKEFVK